MLFTVEELQKMAAAASTTIYSQSVADVIGNKYSEEYGVPSLLYVAKILNNFFNERKCLYAKTYDDNDPLNSFKDVQDSIIWKYKERIDKFESLFGKAPSEDFTNERTESGSEKNTETPSGTETEKESSLTDYTKHYYETSGGNAYEAPTDSFDKGEITRTKSFTNRKTENERTFTNRKTTDKIHNDSFYDSASKSEEMKLFVEVILECLEEAFVNIVRI